MPYLHLMLAVLIAAMLPPSPPAHATDPKAHCEFRNRLVPRLTSRPHYERQVLILKDEMPGQGHRFELFVSGGTQETHSYTLLRTHRLTNQTCIVSAGQADGERDDAHRRAVIHLNDENDPITYTLAICEKMYVISRGSADDSLCDAIYKVFGTSDKAAGYGRILEDHRDAMPWLNRDK